MKKTIINGLLFGIFMGFGLFSTIIGYGVWTNLSTQNDGDIITKDIWNDVVNKVNELGNSPKIDIPSGAIVSFYLNACPEGWEVANGSNQTPDLRGTFVRGMLGNENTRDTSRVLGSFQSDAFQGHWHDIGGQSNGNNNIVAFQDSNTDGAYSAINTGTRGDVYIYVKDPKTDNYNGTPRTANETRPKNVSLLYCMKK